MRKQLKTIALAGFSLLFINACSVSISGQNYETITPEFSLEAFFDGKIKAWGIVQGRDGEILQRFIVDIDAYKENDTLILDEAFTYGYGEGPTKRTWKISKNPDGTYTGNAGDIAGPALGKSHGNAFNFSYEMDLDVDGSEYRVNFDDWFWAFDDNTMMNRSYIKKFGITFAQVTIFMQKQ
ncbi:DUF3833 domain-containing protein [Glaciecola sp. 1036]|uniref:DUF3833 domain-containing protein n=1 Tax=Alteromonadaceae TaxID=72275 RepID=UPI003D034A2E